MPTSLREKFLVDEKGRRVSVVISMRRYRKMLEALEELECIREYDAAKAEGGKPMPFEEAMKRIERARR